MVYAYRDKYNRLHVVYDLYTVKEFARVKTVKYQDEYQGACIDGYPAVLINLNTPTAGRRKGGI